MIQPERRAVTLLERLGTRFTVGDGCWIWTGWIAKTGYGSIGIKHRTQLAHRVMYELLVGSIPEGLHLDHLCRTRACVRPDHLEPVTIGENNRRGDSFSGLNARKTHCKRGHEFTPENTYPARGGRSCRKCGALRARVYKQQRLTRVAIYDARREMAAREADLARSDEDQS